MEWRVRKEAEEELIKLKTSRHIKSSVFLKIVVLWWGYCLNLNFLETKYKSNYQNEW